jgi:hypothetical protein
VATLCWPRCPAVPAPRCPAQEEEGEGEDSEEEEPAEGLPLLPLNTSQQQLQDAQHLTAGAGPSAGGEPHPPSHSLPHHDAPSAVHHLPLVPGGASARVNKGHEGGSRVRADVGAPPLVSLRPGRFPLLQCIWTPECLVFFFIAMLLGCDGSGPHFPPGTPSHALRLRSACSIGFGLIETFLFVYLGQLGGSDLLFGLSLTGARARVSCCQAAVTQCVTLCMLARCSDVRG